MRTSLAGANDGPTAKLWLGRRPETFKPFLDEGIETGKHCFQSAIREEGSQRRANRSGRTYASNSFTGEPVLSSSELAIFTGRPIGLMYFFFQSMPSVW